MKPRRLSLIAVLTAWATFMVWQDLAMRPYRSLRRKVAERLRQSGFDPPAHDAEWVGLSPGDEPRLYEGIGSWDVGFVVLDGQHLIYRGEETSFSIASDEVLGIEMGPRFPAWISLRGVVVRWRRRGGEEGCFTLGPIQARGLLYHAAEARRLCERIERWRNGSATAVASQASTPIPITGPPTAPVTGTSPSEVLRSGPMVITMVFHLAICAGIAALMGLEPLPVEGLGLFDAVIASGLAYLIVALPLIRASRSSRAPTETKVPRAA